MHLQNISLYRPFTDPLQNITITVKVCNTPVLRDDWQLDPHKSLFVVDWAYLQDMQMEDGIVSLNLTNVVNDNDGRGNCCVFMNDTWKPIYNIALMTLTAGT